MSKIYRHWVAPSSNETGLLKDKCICVYVDKEGDELSRKFNIGQEALIFEPKELPDLIRIFVEVMHLGDKRVFGMDKDWLTYVAKVIGGIGSLPYEPAYLRMTDFNGTSVYFPNQTMIEGLYHPRLGDNAPLHLEQKISQRR